MPKRCMYKGGAGGLIRRLGRISLFSPLRCHKRRKRVGIRVSYTGIPCRSQAGGLATPCPLLHTVARTSALPSGAVERSDLFHFVPHFSCVVIPFSLRCALLLFGGEDEADSAGEDSAICSRPRLLRHAVHHNKSSNSCQQAHPGWAPRNA